MNCFRPLPRLSCKDEGQALKISLFVIAKAITNSRSEAEAVLVIRPLAASAAGAKSSKSVVFIAEQ